MRIIAKKSFFALLLLAVLLCSYFFYTQINSIQVLSLRDVPKNIQILEHAHQLPSFWLYVKIENNKIRYGTNFNKANEFWQQRANIIINVLEKIIKNEHKNIDGTYIFSLEDGVHNKYAIPVLGFAATKQLVSDAKVVLIPDFEALKGNSELISSIHKASSLTSWESKRNKIFWRGSANGGNIQSTDIADIPRLKFMALAQKYDFIDAGITSYNTNLNPDFSKKLLQKFQLSSVVSPVDSLAYKYLIDIDGHSCSYSRMVWILHSNSVLLKHQSDKIQWYYAQLQPYVHYIPVANDFSDLDKQYEWMNAHPQKIQDIIANANIIAEKTFSEASILQAMYAGLADYKTHMQNLAKTKVFQIGFNKSGTTTLHKFFAANNIKSVQYVNGNLALSIANNHKNGLPLLDGPFADYVAYFDMNYIYYPQLDIGKDLFKELDKQYPGSKFILNTRDKNKWLKSRCRHIIEHRYSYLTHSACQNRISEEAMLAQWSKDWDEHHKAVIEYFKDRPDDLLIFNIEQDPPHKLQRFFASRFDLDPNLYVIYNATYR